MSYIFAGDVGRPAAFLTGPSSLVSCDFCAGRSITALPAIAELNFGQVVAMGTMGVLVSISSSKSDIAPLAVAE